MAKSEFNSNLQAKLDKISHMPQEVTAKLFPYVVELTPIDKHSDAKDAGHARRSTTYDQNVTIHANYDYAEKLLHQGWSDQLPAGVFDARVAERVAKEVNEYIRRI
jgi:hypothetical protein